MRSIGEFFSRIQNKQAQALFIRKSIQETVLKLTKIELPLEKISFKGKNVVLDGLNSAEKSEIFLKKSHILRAVGEQGLPRVVADIKF